MVCVCARQRVCERDLLACVKLAATFVCVNTRISYLLYMHCCQLNVILSHASLALGLTLPKKATIQSVFFLKSSTKSFKLIC